MIYSKDSNPIQFVLKNISQISNSDAVSVAPYFYLADRDYYMENDHIYHLEAPITDKNLLSHNEKAETCIDINEKKLHCTNFEIKYESPRKIQSIGTFKDIDQNKFILKF